MSGRGPPGRAYGARPPSHVAYFVALGGVVLLLALLLLYCVYYCCAKVKELKDEQLSPVPNATPKSYPVQPGVREGAQAMAKICRQLPSNVKSNLTAVTASRDVITPSTVDTSVASRTDSSNTDTSNVNVNAVTMTSHDDTFPSTNDDRDVMTASKATFASNAVSPSFVLPTDGNVVSTKQRHCNQTSQESITNVTSLSFITSENSLSLTNAAVCGTDVTGMSLTDVTGTSLTDVGHSSDIFDNDVNLVTEINQTHSNG